MDETQTTEDYGLANYIQGATLSFVQFIMDYLIIGFDKNDAITTLVWPELIIQDKTTLFGMPGYRDLLCGCIMSIVHSVNVKKSKKIDIILSNGLCIHIPIKSYGEAGEQVIFSKWKGPCIVW